MSSDAVADYSTVSAQELEKQRLEGLAQEILELKLVYLSDAENAGREADQLRKQINWLTGLVVVAIAIMGGALTWLTFSLRTEQNQLMQQVDAIATDTVSSERINRLETQLSDLVEQIPPTLSRDLETSQTQLDELANQIDTVASSVNTRRQTIAILARALQDLINEEEADALTPESAPAPDASSPTPNGATEPEAAAPAPGPATNGSNGAN